MSGQNYIGSKISLISLSDIRYVGILHNINPLESTVALQNVKSYGTEGRKRNPSEEIAPSDTVFDYVVFRGSDIKDLQVYEAPPAFQSELASAQQQQASPASQPQQQPLRHQPTQAQTNPVMNTMPPTTSAYSSAYYQPPQMAYNSYSPYGNANPNMAGNNNNAYWQPNPLASNNFASQLPQQQHPFAYQPHPQPQPPIQMPVPEPYQQPQQAASPFENPVSANLGSESGSNDASGDIVKGNHKDGKKPSTAEMDNGEMKLPVVQEKEEIYVDEPALHTTTAAATIAKGNAELDNDKDAELLAVETLSKQVSALEVKQVTKEDKTHDIEKKSMTTSIVEEKEVHSSEAMDPSEVQPVTTTTTTTTTISSVIVEEEKVQKKKQAIADTTNKSKKQSTATKKSMRPSPQAPVQRAATNNNRTAGGVLDTNNETTDSKKQSTQRRNSNQNHRRNSNQTGFTLPKTDFDFASANARFDKNEHNDDETIVIPEPEHFYNKNKSFFDDISCESKEFQEGTRTNIKYREEGKLNIETFGQANAGAIGASNGRRGRGGRGAGRGGRQQGRGGRSNRSHPSSTRRDIKA